MLVGRVSAAVAASIVIYAISDLRYHNDVIKDFADKETRKLFEGANSKAVPGDVRERAEIKLEALDAATSLEDLEIPPGNRLEALGGDRKGQHSIRINLRVNRRCRVCFVFDENVGDAHDVEIADYH